MEDLGFSAFIAGTAIGYLVWYWAYGRHSQQEQAAEATPPKRKKYEQAAIAASALVLVAIILWREYGAAHPLGPLQWSSLNETVVIGVAVVVVAFLVAMLWSSVRGPVTADSYAKVFRSTLVIVFGFILVMSLLVFFLGPHSLHWRSSDRWIATAPFGELLLGVLFGSVGAEWLNFLMSDHDPSKTIALEIQHRRWGYVLAGLLLLGILTPLMPQLMGMISSASVTTPLGGVSISTQPITTIRNTNQSNVGTETRETRIWDTLGVFNEVVERDNKYLAVFYGGRPKEVEAVKSLHTDGDWFAEEVLAPLGTCIQAHFGMFNNRGLIQRHLHDVLLSYRKLLHPPPDDGQTDASALKGRMAAAANALANDMNNARDPKAHEPCIRAEKRIEAARNWDATRRQNETTIIIATLPYPAMGLAFLLFDSGETEEAMRELSSWIEDHYSTSGKARIEACNRRGNADDSQNAQCAYIAYRPGKGEKWLPLPAWYRIRVGFELVQMLNLTINRRISFSVSHDMVHAIESLFGESDIKSAYEWAKCGSHLRTWAGTENERTKSRMVVAYLSLVDSMLQNLSYVVKEGLTDSDATISPEMLKYAEENTAVDLRCQPYLAGRESDRDTYIGEFKATYGILLTQVVLQGSASSDLERATRNDMAANARTALKYAIPILRERVDSGRRDLSRKPLQDRLFSLLEEQDYLRRAEGALRTLDGLAR